ncbi:hypothetical protein [Halospeciosus flavus]|uniref:YgiT-type zinc finger domain-containing protein n=1 Tax=Halospeciosus flavus TaxID=3032283 RepID=A0ABD5Z370_9EURY|nr:hypothetical protein [Halospeciosus flavus]
MECPGCGSTALSQEVGPEWPIGTSLADAILDVDVDGRIVLARNCWTCGWSEERVVRVESIDETSGDPDVVERRRLLDTLTDTLEDVEDTETLERLLEDVRARRTSDGSRES